MDIQFTKVERDCPRNQEIRDKGETRGIIYDYTVTVDGVLTAIFKGDGYKRRYTLADMDGTEIRRPYDPRRARNTIEAEKQADFEAVFLQAQAEGHIPTRADLDRRAAEKQAADELAAAARRAQADTAVELAAAQAREQALRDALKSISTNTGHVACHTETEYLGFIQSLRLAATAALSAPADVKEADRYAARKLFKITEGRHHEETITMYELRRIAHGFERS